MPRARYRSAWICVAVVALAASRATGAGADPPPLTGSMQCEHAPEPGRVMCTIEARATGGRTVGWADAVLVELPEFTAALKGRIGPGDVTAQDPGGRAWAFALVARAAGEGEVRARVRAVVCEAGDAGPPRCAPTTIELRAAVTVG